MPDFFICNRSQVSRRVRSLQATHLVSLLDPARTMWKPSAIPAENWLWLKFQDQEKPGDFQAPTREHAQHILAWGRQLPHDARVVVHCEAGISRSTASALALKVQAHGGIAGARAWIDHERPHACPNMLLAEFFDQLLDLQGEFIALCEDIGATNIKRLLI